MPQVEKITTAEVEIKKPKTLERPYEYGEEVLAAIGGTEPEVESSREDSEVIDVHVGDMLFVERTDGTIEKAPVVMGDDGELALEVYSAKLGGLGHRPVTEDLKQRATQDELRSRLAQQRMANEARDDIDNMTWHIPAPRFVEAPDPAPYVPERPPYEPDKLEERVHIRVIDAQPDKVDEIKVYHEEKEKQKARHLARSERRGWFGKRK